MGTGMIVQIVVDWIIPLFPMFSSSKIVFPFVISPIYVILNPRILSTI